jgi:prolyl-tRNA synthetase
MFDITVEDPTPLTGTKPGHIYLWQNSWGLSTRALGVMVMIHGDDRGLVLPPRVAQDQVIIIPVGINKRVNAEDRERYRDELHNMKSMLRKAGIRADYDIREGYTPAWKFNDHELKGVPLRLEYGPEDAAKSVVSYARRDTGEKGTIAISDLVSSVRELLETIQKDMYKKADAAFRTHRKIIIDWDEVEPALDAKYVVIIPSCLTKACEIKIKDLTAGRESTATAADASVEKVEPKTGMKSLCIPLEQPEGIVNGVTKCLNPECDAFAEKWGMLGRSY